MSYKKIYMTIGVLFILLIALSTISATNTTTDTDTSMSTSVESGDIEANSIEASSDYSSTPDERIDTSILNKEQKKNIKQIPPDKDEMKISLDDYYCNVNDTIHAVTHMDPPGVTDGVLIYYIDEDVAATCNLTTISNEWDFDMTDYSPGAHQFDVEFVASLSYESAYATSTIYIYKNLDIECNQSSINYTKKTQPAGVQLSCDNRMDYDEYGYYSQDYAVGDMQLYIDDQLVKSYENIEYHDYNVIFDDTLLKDIGTGNHTWSLKFNPESIYARINNLTGTLNIQFSNISLTTIQSIDANVGDTVTIPFTLSPMAEDGKLSVSYAQGADNTIDIDSTTSSIDFDTTDYLPGEYILVLSYYDSSYYNPNSTQLTLNLYQPTTITADKQAINVVLGKDNTYTIEFTTSRDSWDDVIWGSVDVYIDDEIIDTLIVDDDTGNTALLVLDDYNMEDLTPGEHTLTAIFTSDNPYIQTSTTTLPLTVTGDLILELPVNITTNTTNTITVPVNVTFNNQNVNTGTLSYYINNTLAGTLDLSTGTTIKTLANNYNPGTYTLQVDYNDPSNIYPAQTNTTTLIIQSNTTITTTILNDTIRNTTIQVELKDDKNNNIEGYVNITLPSGEITQNIHIPLNGLNITYNNLENGTNTFTINYSGDIVYANATSTVSVDVVLLNSTTTATVTNNTIDNTTIHVQVVDEKTAIPVNGGKVEIINTDNNLPVATATLDDTGSATITTNIDSTGTYNLKINYLGNEEYNTSTTQINNIIVEKRESQLNTNINNNTYQNTSINITLKDPITGTPISNAPITVTLPDGQTINTYTDNNGNATIALNLAVGENTVRIDYPGNNKYNSSSQEVNINVAQRPSHTTATLVNNTIKNTTITATVTDKTTGNPITNGNIRITDTITGNIVATGTLNGQNTITLTTNIATAGTYQLRVEYLGNTNYTPSTTLLENVVVQKRQSMIETTVNNDTQANTTITITLTDPATDTPLPNMPITVTLPTGQTINTQTDENGTVTINPDLPVGDNTITITYPGNEEYNTTTLTETVNIQKRPSNTTAVLNNNTIGNTTITVTVRDATTRQAITDGEITITNTANNEIIARSTITDRNTIIAVNINQGQYTLRIDYHGNTNYTPSNTILEDITIIKRSAIINVTTINNSVADTKINVTIKDATTGMPISNAPITVRLPDGQTINTHTGATGTTTITLDLPADTQTINIAYTGSTTYQSKSTDYTINIEKLESSITTTKANGYIGENITLHAQITDKDGNPITGGRVIFKLNDLTLKDENNNTLYASVQDGQATISYFIPYNYQAKTYKVQAVYSGDDQYNGSRSNTPLVNLRQRQARLTLNNNPSVEVDENITFHVTVTDKKDTKRTVNGYIIFKIDGLTLKDENNQTIQVALQDNQATYTYTIGHQYSARKHTITAVLINNTYMRSQENNTFNITQTTAQIQLNTPKLNANRQVEITGQILDEAGHTLTGQNTALVKLNGQTLKTDNGSPQYYTINDGQINITLPEMTYKHDTYQLEVVTGQRGAFTGARNTTTLTTNTNKDKTLKAAAITTQQLVNIKADQTITPINTSNNIKLKITDSMNKKINTGQITYTLQAKTISQADVKNGQAKLDYTFTTPGTYTITANYHDNTKQYQTTKKTITIKAIDTRTPATIKTTTTKANVGETITYTITTLDKYQNPIKEGKITTKINNQTITNTLTNGITTITLTLNKTGTYTITHTYTGTTNYQPANKTNTITISKKTPKITITTKTLTAGKTNNLTSTITTQDNVPLNKGKIQWKINGITHKDTKGNPIQTLIIDGTSTLNYNIPSKWAGKQINITTTYTGSANYNTRQVTKNVTIPQNQAIAKITLPQNIYTKDNITIQVKITDKNTGKPAPDQKIAIKINGKTINTPRLKNGSATIQYKLPLLKTNRTHNITVVFGNKNYKRLDANKKFNIQRINTTLTLKDITIKKGQTLHIKTIIKDTHNEVMQRNNTYCIKLNQKTIHTGKLKNGILNATIPLNYKPRTYTLTIKTGNNYYYNGLTKDTKLTITQ